MYLAISVLAGSKNKEKQHRNPLRTIPVVHDPDSILWPHLHRSHIICDLGEGLLHRWAWNLILWLCPILNLLALFDINIDRQGVDRRSFQGFLLVKRGDKFRTNLAGSKVLFSTGILSASSHNREEQISFQVVITQTWEIQQSWSSSALPSWVSHISQICRIVIWFSRKTPSFRHHS